jgi:hypothetical protein
MKGKTWHTAALDPAPKIDDAAQPFGEYNRAWAWRLWSVDVPITKVKCILFD